MESGRVILSKIMGGIQCMLGGAASVLAYLTYVSPETREMIGVSQEEIALFTFLFLVFGTFSIVSGMILMREQQ
jgi:hypothetical protein